MDPGAMVRIYLLKVWFDHTLPTQPHMDQHECNAFVLECNTLTYKVQLKCTKTRPKKKGQNEQKNWHGASSLSFQALQPNLGDVGDSISYPHVTSTKSRQDRCAISGCPNGKYFRCAFNKLEKGFMALGSCPWYPIGSSLLSTQSKKKLLGYVVSKIKKFFYNLSNWITKSEISKPYEEIL